MPGWLWHLCRGPTSATSWTRNRLRHARGSPSYPLEFLHRNRRAYLDLADLVGGINVVAPMPIQDVRRRVIDDTLAVVLSAHLEHPWRDRYRSTRSAFSGFLLRMCGKRS